MVDDTILTTAARVTTKDRNQDYGTPLDNHGRTARFWSDYLGVKVTPEQVCFMNILQKISRGMENVTRDTLVDIAGYARNVEMIQEERAKTMHQDSGQSDCYGKTALPTVSGGSYQSQMVPEMPGVEEYHIFWEFVQGRRS